MRHNLYPCEASTMVKQDTSTYWDQGNKTSNFIEIQVKISYMPWSQSSASVLPPCVPHLLGFIVELSLRRYLVSIIYGCPETAQSCVSPTHLVSVTELHLYFEDLLPLELGYLQFPCITLRGFLQITSGVQF